MADKHKHLGPLKAVTSTARHPYPSLKHNSLTEHTPQSRMCFYYLSIAEFVPFQSNRLIQVNEVK